MWSVCVESVCVCVGGGGLVCGCGCATCCSGERKWIIRLSREHRARWEGKRDAGSNST